MKRPNPELIEQENPAWTEEDFAKAVPFTALPAELQEIHSSEKRVTPDGETPSARQPAA
jgi:hypothetical protein